MKDTSGSSSTMEKYTQLKKWVVFSKYNFFNLDSFKLKLESWNTNYWGLNMSNNKNETIGSQAKCRCGSTRTLLWWRKGTIETLRKKPWKSSWRSWSWGSGSRRGSPEAENRVTKINQKKMILKLMMNRNITIKVDGKVKLAWMIKVDISENCTKRHKKFLIKKRSWIKNSRSF